MREIEYQAVAMRGGVVWAHYESTNRESVERWARSFVEASCLFTCWGWSRRWPNVIEVV